MQFFFLFFQTRTLCQYVLSLAKYDQNFDIRDRGRFLRFLLFPTDKTEVCQFAAMLFFLRVMFM